MESLPNDALHNILSRLPIHRLMQYRSVCKAWLSLIDDPYFRKDLHSQEQPVMAFGCVYGQEHNRPTLYKITRRGEEMRAVEIASFPEIGLVRCQYKKKIRSCNGFILFERWDDIAVLNPLTKEIVRVPGSPYRQILYRNVSIGFDPSSNTYKLVQLVVLDRQDVVTASIYDFGRGCWRCCSATSRSPSFLCDRVSDISDGVYVSGTLNWVYQDSTGYDRGGYFISFDLGREEFSVVHTPMDLSDVRTRVELIELGGSIGLCEISPPRFVEIWVPHDLRKHLWIKKISIVMDLRVSSTDDIEDVYCYEDNIVIRERRYKFVLKRERNGKKKISETQEVHFVHHPLDNKVPVWEAKDELSADLYVYSAQCNVAGLAG